MCRVVIQRATDVTVPEWVQDRASFHRWAASDEFPEYGRVDYLAGELWVDVGDEQIYSHNQVRLAYTVTLASLRKAERTGQLFVAGIRVENPEADWSVMPDAVYFTDQRLKQGRVWLVPGTAGGYVRIAGAPDMLLEVACDSSADKDKGRLRELYWRAGVREYWLADARADPPAFTILRHTTRGYAAVRRQDGWVKSPVFGKAFRLTVRPDRLGYPDYTLAVR